MGRFRLAGLTSGYQLIKVGDLTDWQQPSTTLRVTAFPWPTCDSSSKQNLSCRGQCCHDTDARHRTATKTMVGMGRRIAWKRMNGFAKSSVQKVGSLHHAKVAHRHIVPAFQHAGLSKRQGFSIAVISLSHVCTRDFGLCFKHSHGTIDSRLCSSQRSNDHSTLRLLFDPVAGLCA